jgi:hypothetical protein
MRTLRSLAITFAFALALASATAHAQGVIHKVSVGGPDQDAVDHTDANFSLSAVEHGDGTVTGQWTDQFGQKDGGIHVQINCLSVAGNTAWVSGIITSGNVSGVDVTGLPVITEVQDNGTSANDPPDAISFSFIGNATPCTAQPALPLFPMTSGQVTVN